MAYFLGLDSGGTKTECWLGDETSVLAEAVCPTVKLTRVSEEVATERMRGLLAEVAAKSGVALKDMTRTCVGAAGHSIREVRRWMQKVVSEAVGGSVEVCGDQDIALDAAFRGGPGVLVIAGTGSNVVGRCADGRKFTAGGWGPAIGDEGSGYWIGWEAVRQGFRALDRGVDSGLLEAVRLAWGAKDLNEMVAMAHAHPGPEFAALVPLVVHCRAENDPVATRVLMQACVELADQVEVVWKKMQACGEESARVAFTGSVLEKIAEVRGLTTRRIERQCEGLRVMDAPVRPLDGAMWRARGGRGSS